MTQAGYDPEAQAILVQQSESLRTHFDFVQAVSPFRQAGFAWYEVHCEGGRQEFLADNCSEYMRVLQPGDRIKVIAGDKHTPIGLDGSERRPVAEASIDGIILYQNPFFTEKSS